ncbi:VOC family protein [Agromyces sp. Marseille-Q5079]|uniref:VOC family protein n=1 Tax=Agromyces sp. Marseille-Q5079 TaxID=3439059 RepID=UPI003D9CB24C
MRLHHVQVSMPRGQEEEARRFYGEALGMVEVPKAPSLAGRGGCWFRSFTGEVITAEIHVGVDDPFVPARKAHPALLLDSVRELEEVGRRVADAGFDVSWEDRDTFEGYVRFHARDGFGNRVEILAPAES